jgi:hypothetical protein
MVAAELGSRSASPRSLATMYMSASPDTLMAEVCATGTRTDTQDRGFSVSFELVTRPSGAVKMGVSQAMPAQSSEQTQPLATHLPLPLHELGHGGVRGCSDLPNGTAALKTSA